MGASDEDYSGVQERGGSWLGPAGAGLFASVMLALYAIALFLGGMYFLLSLALRGSGAEGD